MKLDIITAYLEVNEEHRTIAKKNQITLHYIKKLYPRLLNVGSDDTLVAIIEEVLDIDRKIRLAKQEHPHLKGDTELEKSEYEEHAKELLGISNTP